MHDETEDTVGPQPTRVFQNAWNAAVGQLEKGQWEEALFTLSLRYNDPDVTGEARTRLMDLLDPLAGRVIYSNEHTMDPPYLVRPGDTLQSIADQHQIPMALLQNINGIRDPNALQPGTKLKVLSGPFRAEIDRKQSELVLFLDRYYAGRFAISVGNDPEPTPAEYVVKAKQPGREYYTRDQSKIPAKAPDNPYGDWWIGLGRDGVGGDGPVGDVCIHGSPEPTPLHAGLGCVSLSSADAADVYHILSVGSKVVVR
jgi:LysM repeat protein